MIATEVPHMRQCKTSPPPDAKAYKSLERYRSEQFRLYLSVRRLSVSTSSTPDYPYHKASKPERKFRLTRAFHSARISGIMERPPGFEGQYKPSDGAASEEAAQPLQIETIWHGQKPRVEQPISAHPAETLETSALGPMEASDVKDVRNNLNYSVSPDGGSPMKARIPDEDLFQEDTEQWLAKYMGDLSPRQIEEQLQMIRMVSLLGFYEAVAELHPELLDELPKIPRILVSGPLGPG